MSQIFQNQRCRAHGQRRLGHRLPVGVSYLLPGLLTLCLAGCSSLLAPAKSELPKRYSLDSLSGPTMPNLPTQPAHPAARTLLVSMPHETVGFDSVHMIYLRQPHQLEYFAHSEWIDTPARMLLPRITESLGASGIFAAVLSGPASARADFVLDVQLLRLQQEFLTRPSQLHLTLRVVLLDNTRHQVLAWRELDSRVETSTENAFGGVLASHQAVQAVLQQLVAFCRDHGGVRVRPAPTSP
jgi:cholesterol transport system auxiliary component